MQKRHGPAPAFKHYRTHDSFPLSCFLEIAETERQKRLFPRHYHDQVELGYCHSGEGVFAAGRLLLRYRAGDAIVIPPGVPHHMRSRRGGSSVWSWAFFEPQRLLAGPGGESGLMEPGALWTPRSVHHLSSAERPSTVAAVQRVFDELRAKAVWRYDAIRACIRLILIDIARLPQAGDDTETECGNAAMIARIRPALETVRDRYQARLSIEQLARDCGMAGTTFRHHFRLCMGVTPYQYILAYRVTMASLALQHQHGRKLSAIATENGFPTLSSFLRAFRRHTGQSPRRWSRMSGVSLSDSHSLTKGSM